MTRLALPTYYGRPSVGNNGKGTLAMNPSDYSALQNSTGTAALEALSGEDGETKVTSITYNAGADSFAQLELAAGDRFLVGQIDSVATWVRNPGSTYLHFQVLIYETGAGRLIRVNLGCPPDNEWHLASACYGQFVTNNLLTTDIIRYVRHVVYPTAKAWVAGDKLYFGKTYINPHCRPKFVLCTDDGNDDNVLDGTGYPTDYPATGGNYKTILDAYGFRASAFIITSLVGTTNYLTWAQIATLAAAGWDICNHSTAGYVGGGTDGMCLLTAAQVEADLVTAREALTARGYGSTADIFGLPQGAFDSDVIAGARAAGMTTIVGISTYNNGATIPIAQPSGGAYTNLHDAAQGIGMPGWIDFSARVQVDGSPTAANLTAFVDQLIRCGASGGCYTHGIDAAIAVKCDALCAYLYKRQKEGLIDVVTMSEWRAGLTGKRIAESTGRIPA